MLDVGALLEDAENRGGMLEHVDELQEHNAQVCLQKLCEKNKIMAVFLSQRRLCAL